jgi:FkbM family methyltransferase
MPLLVRRLCNKASPLVVDGGAHRGDFVDAIRKHVPAARFVCFEPDPYLSAELQRRFGADRGVTVIAAALGDQPGTASLHINQERATNSLLASTAQATGHLREVTSTKSLVTVEVTTIDAALARAGQAGADIVKLDLQGYDYKALQGATRTLDSASVVVSEVWFAPTYEEADDYLDVCTLLDERGFSLYSLTTLHYSREDRLLWADAIFVPRASAAWQEPFSH